MASGQLTTIINEARLVHLDLKGAPPKLSYYEQLFPSLQRWGATGLLVEYEDMFPYQDDLSVLQAPYAYSEDDIQRFLKLAASFNLEVIPLVQTFGHFEFVLKHERFHDIREIPEYPLSLCPLHEGSLEVVKSMIKQMIRLHPDIHYFHIGADEVFHIGVCEKCAAFVSEHEKKPETLFFHHIRNVIDFINETAPHLKIIMWDDMYRQLDVDALKASGISERVEPMIWYYMNVMNGLPADLFARYSKVFPAVWCATAFKGATGPCMQATDIGHHVCNHQGWLELREAHAKLFQTWRGTAITGWQRYDHYAVLCEILPVAIPSLAICLLTLKTGAFTREVHEAASADLGFSGPLPLNPYSIIGAISDCKFPGAKLYNIVQYYLKLCSDYKFVKNDRLKGWMSAYHIKHNYANPAHIIHFLQQVKTLLATFTQLKQDTREALAEIFFPDTVDEWLTNNFDKKMDTLGDIISTAERLVDIGARPKQELERMESEEETKKEDEMDKE